MKTKYSLLTKISMLAICISSGISLSAQNADIQASSDGQNQMLIRSFDGSELTGLRMDDDGNFKIMANSTDEAFRIFDELPLNVRVGTSASAPLGKFEIFHDSSSGLTGEPQLNLHEDSTNDFARLKFTSNSTDFWTLAGAGGTTDAFNVFYHDGTTGSNLLSIEGGGDVGIGISDPSTKLHVFDTGSNVARFESSGINNFISFYNSSGYSGYIQATGSEFQMGSTSKDIVLAPALTTSDIILKSAGVDVLTLDGATNSIGIGTDTPGEKLDVIGNIHANGAIKLNLGTATSEYINESTGKGVNMASTGGGDNIHFRDHVTNDLLISMNGVNERFGVRIHPNYTAHINHLSGVPGATTGNGLTIENEGGSNHWSFYNFTTGDLSIYSSGSFRGSFDDVSGSYTPVSDRRVKTNINVMGSMMDKILALKPSTYNMIDDNSNELQFGLIAQEVQEVFPEITPTVETVAEGAAFDKLGVSYTELVPVLIKGMQEQQAIIEQLKADIEILKNK